MSSSLYVALRSGHEHTVNGLDTDTATSLRERIVAHLEARESHPTLDLGDGTVLRTDAVVLARVHDDGPRTGFVGT
ncbi:hypothetical protein [Actinomycetospora aeridis]|uniref:Uncharacterized protein n=1 Tax=Actinomycetospora aeridis TaxID=3129231 RepID=A0ABU8N9D4_9PSEU